MQLAGATHLGEGGDGAQDIPRVFKINAGSSRSWRYIQPPISHDTRIEALLTAMKGARMSNSIVNADGGGAAAAGDRYLRLPEVLTFVGVSWRTLARWEREGCFPKRYKIGPRIVAWKKSEITDWFLARETATTVARAR